MHFNQNYKMSEDILDEYVRLTRAIENVRNKINQYKKNIDYDISNSKSEKEQQKHVDKFKNVINRIKNDDDITGKYRRVKARHQELKRVLLRGLEIQSKMKANFSNDNKSRSHTTNDFNNQMAINPHIISETSSEIILNKLKTKYEFELRSDPNYDHTSNINYDHISNINYDQDQNLFKNKFQDQDTDYSGLLREIEYDLIKKDSQYM